MDEIILRDDIFYEQFLLFKQKIRFYSNGEEFKSFDNGIPEKWEFYKRFVHIEGNARLNINSWKKEDIGSGKILEHVINAIEINTPKNSENKIELQNNLLQWNLKNGEQGRAHKSLYEALAHPQNKRIYENLLFNFYFNLVDDETAFNQFIELAGKKYPFIAYLLFLKNREKYLPIAPETFDTAFKMLKISFKTSHNCSWDNYQTFLKIIKKIKENLEIETGLSRIELIDAHSFCWMLVKLPTPTKFETQKREIPVRKPLGIILKTPVSFPSSTPKEGLKISYEDYLNKYKKNLNIGRKTEVLVCNSERNRLKKAGKLELAKEVKRVSDNPSLGYDIESREIDGTKIFIEVKAVRSFKEILSFNLSRNEWEKSQSMDNYFFYFVSCIKEQKREIDYIRGKELISDYMIPSEYLVKLPLLGR